MSEKLYVVACVSNPQQYESRYRLYRVFAKYMQMHSNVEFYTIEHAFKDRPYVVTDRDNPYHFQVRGDQEFWLKENLLNIAINRLPQEAKKVAWIDADIQFMNPNWVQDTLDALDHFKFVQMFSEYSDLGPNYELLGKSTSFMYDIRNGDASVTNYYGNAQKGATGLAWAANIEDLMAIGGIPDVNIIGAGDWYLAYYLVGLEEAATPDWLSDGYKHILNILSHECRKHIRRNVGYVKGHAVHYWHGKKHHRGYGWRERILKKYNFDPVMDLTKDRQGLYIVNREKAEMLNEIRDYFMSRNEDSMEL